MVRYRWIARHRGTQVCQEFFFETLKEARRANPDYVEWEQMEVMPDEFQPY